MKNIYHIHQSSNSYWDNRWTDTDYYLCDSEDEYQQKLAEYTEKRKQIEKDFGKEFDAFGFCWSKRLERSTHYKYYLKPGSVCNETRSSAVGRFTGYGS